MKISVILTSYNHENFLAESIESIINQTYRDFELIIVDDCSTDSSWHIIEKYKNAYPEIIILRHEYNWGNGNVADAVKNYASGEYIAVHHSDDVWELDKLEKQMAVFNEHPDYAAIFTNARAIDDKEQSYEDKDGFYYNLFQVENRSRHEWLNYFFFHGNCLCHPSILVKKSVYEENHFFKKGLKQIPDFIKWIQICKTYEIYVIPEVLVKFRVHSAGQNTSGMRAETQIRSTVELFLMLQEYADIQDKKEFFSIFPEARKYCTGNNISTKYVFGRICTEEGMPPYTRLFGVQLLYQALNSEDPAEQLQIQRSFSVNQFIRMNGKYDLFGMLPTAFEQDRSIYYDCGNGYTAENVIKQRYTLGQKLIFHMKSHIHISEEQGIKRLRFDPAEGVLISAKIESVTVNGENVTFSAENALQMKDGNDIFVNMDPIYELKLPPHIINASQMDVEIRGVIARLTDSEVGSIVTEFMYHSRDEQNVLIDKLSQEEEARKLCVSEKENLLEEKNKIERSYAAVSEELNKVLRDKEDLKNTYEIISDELRKTMEYKLNLEKENKSIISSLNEMSEIKTELENNQILTLEKLSNVSDTAKKLEESNNALSEELKRIKNSRWYKVWNKYMRMRERRQKSE